MKLTYLEQSFAVAGQRWQSKGSIAEQEDDARAGGLYTMPEQRVMAEQEDGRAKGR